jgi:hypothetical protein
LPSFRFVTKECALIAMLPTVLTVLAYTAAFTQEPPGAKPADGEVFGLTRMHRIHLQVAAKEWERMQPKGMPMPFAFPKKQPEKPADPAAAPADVHKSAGFGLEFPWAHADVTADDASFKDVGLRYKGNGSYVTSMQSLKRNFKIDLQHYDGDALWHGRKSITLNAGAMDPGRLREALAYAVYRAAGVPAPRTAFAEVSLTVPGKHDREFLGLYTLVEPVDKTFLKDHFKNAKGLLLKPEKLRGLDYLGEDWAKYVDRYQPKREASAKEAQRVIAFIKLVNFAEAEQFQKEIGNYIEVDEFLRFVAVTALVANLDSFLSVGHNYYLYLHPQTNRLVIIPWDLDLAFAGFPFAGTPDQQAELSLMRPYFGQHKLLERLFAMPEIEAQYRKVVRALTAGCFTKERLFADIDALEKITREPLAREKQAAEARKEGKGGFLFAGPGGMFGKSVDVRSFIDKRTVAVAAQLDGKSKGYVPVIGFGPPGGPGGGPAKFGPGNFFAKPLLPAIDTDKDGKLSLDAVTAAVKQFFDDCDKEKTGKLDEATLGAGIARLFPMPPGGAAGKAPAGFGPGKVLAASIFKRADTDKDGKLTREELVGAAAVWFREADKDKKGALDEPAFAAGLNLLFPPPAFGPPGGPPPGANPPLPKKDEKN